MYFCQFTPDHGDEDEDDEGYDDDDAVVDNDQICPPVLWRSMQ